MNVVDSSAWLDFFAGGPNADFFAPAIEKPSALVVPSVCIYEVFKKVLQQRGEYPALAAVGVMQQAAKVVDLTPTLALGAAKLSVEHDLPFADAVILATTRAFHARLWTQDEHFDGLPDVEYRRHPKKRTR
jgi:predicted nucleic acid-binding protein